MSVLKRSVKGCLDGIKVLDMSRILAGPYCAQLLGDLGAEVIKVEQPIVGDGTRGWGPPFVGKEQKETAYFMSVNRNKRSVALDLKSAEGLKIVKELVKRSDVLIENFVPGGMEKLGLGANELLELNPRLVYCSITGFGPTGPYRDRPGFDLIASAMYGLMHITGLPEDDASGEWNEPAKPGVAVTDVLTGLNAQAGILAALYERDVSSGAGQKVDTSLMEAQLSAMVNVASSYLCTGRDDSKKYGSAHQSIVPYQAFPTADGLSIVIAAGTDRQFRELCTLLGSAGDVLAADERYHTNRSRVIHRNTLIPTLKDIFSGRPRAEWEDVLEGHGGVPFASVRSIKDAFDCVQARHRGMVQEVAHPAVSSDDPPLRVVGPPVKFSRSSTGVRLAPPLLGEHTRSVLTGLLHMTDADVDRLAQEGIVQCA